MTDQQRIRITALSLILAFCVQAIAITWFLANMRKDLDILQAETEFRKSAVYSINNLKSITEWNREIIRDLDSRIKALEGRR